LAFIGIHLYYSANNELPELNDLKKAEEIFKICNNYFLIIKEKYKEYLKIKKK
jgi:hypothetical protein